MVCMLYKACALLNVFPGNGLYIIPHFKTAIGFHMSCVLYNMFFVYTSSSI